VKTLKLHQFPGLVFACKSWTIQQRKCVNIFGIYVL